MQPAAMRGDFARSLAREIAQAHDLGLITCRLPCGKFVPAWLVTAAGLKFIHRSKH